MAKPRALRDEPEKEIAIEREVKRRVHFSSLPEDFPFPKCGGLLKIKPAVKKTQAAER